MTFKSASWWNSLWHCLVHHTVQKCVRLDVLKQSTNEVMCECNIGSEIDPVNSESDDSFACYITTNIIIMNYISDYSQHHF